MAIIDFIYTSVFLSILYSKSIYILMHNHSKYKVYNRKRASRRKPIQNLLDCSLSFLLPKPFAECNYYHRNLNVKKLVDIQFTYLPHNMNMARAKNFYKLPTELPVKGFRPMEQKDVENPERFLNEQQQQISPQNLLALKLALQNKLRNNAENQNVPQNVPRNVPQSARHSKLVTIINQNNSISKEELASHLNVTVMTIKRDLKALGIVWEGASKTGHWVFTHSSDDEKCPDNGKPCQVNE